MSDKITVKLQIKKECVAVYSDQGFKYHSCKWVPGLSVEFPSDCVLVELPTIPKEPAEDKQEFATQDDQAKLYKHLNDRITALERKDVTPVLEAMAEWIESSTANHQDKRWKAIEAALATWKEGK